MYYSVLGSDNVENNAVRYREIGEIQTIEKYTLRTGRLYKPERSFESGCDILNGNKEIYLTDEIVLSKSDIRLSQFNKQAYIMASRLFKGWNKMSQIKKDKLARNVHILLGKDLNTPSKFLININTSDVKDDEITMALKLAKNWEIPVFSFGDHSKSTESQINYGYNSFVYNIIKEESI